MMKCAYCGRNLAANAKSCEFCGADADKIVDTSMLDRIIDPEIRRRILNLDQSKSYFWWGFLLSVWLNLIGLVVGLLLFKPETNARRTFVKGWLIGLVVLVVIVVAFFAFGITVASSMGLLHFF